MRYYEIAGHKSHLEHDDPRRTLSLYVADSEFAACGAMIRAYDGLMVGVTKVPVGGMTLQVRCSTVDAAYELFASWLNYTNQGPRRSRTEPKRAT